MNEMSHVQVLETTFCVIKQGKVVYNTPKWWNHFPDLAYVRA